MGEGGEDSRITRWSENEGRMVEATFELLRVRGSSFPLVYSATPWYGTLLPPTHPSFSILIVPLSPLTPLILLLGLTFCHSFVLLPPCHHYFPSPFSSSLFFTPTPFPFHPLPVLVFPSPCPPFSSLHWNNSPLPPSHGHQLSWGFQWVELWQNMPVLSLIICLRYAFWGT